MRSPTSAHMKNLSSISQPARAYIYPSQGSSVVLLPAPQPLLGFLTNLPAFIPEVLEYCLQLHSI